ncbi:MAG: phage tail protein [Velocimicrobium sp.]
MALINNKLTNAGKRIIADSIASGEENYIKFTKIALGDGTTSHEWTTLANLIHTVSNIAIQKVKASGDSNDNVTVRGIFTNTELISAFYFRELGLYAIDKTTGNEVLFSYGNAGDNAEEIPLSSSKMVEKIIDLVITVSNTSSVSLTVASSVYASKEDLEDAIDVLASKVNSDLQNQVATVEGVLISEKTVDGSVLPKYIFGKGGQLTLTGKNKLPKLTNQTVLGVTATVADDGAVTLNGTSTGIVVFGVALGFILNGTYTISTNNTSTNGNITARLAKSDGSSTLLQSVLTSVNSYASADFSNVSDYYFQIRIASGTTLSNFVIKSQLETGSVATTYEQYCGGVPSPSPDYPQEGQNLGTYNATTGEYETEIVAHGKNFAEIVNLGTAWEYTTSGIKNKAQNNAANIINKLLPPGTYKIGIKFMSLPSTGTSFAAYIDEVQNVGIGIYNVNNYALNTVYSKTLTLTKTSVLKYIMFGNTNIEFFEFQFWIEKEILTSYEQYTGNEITISLDEPLRGIKQASTATDYTYIDSDGNKCIADYIYRNNSSYWIKRNIGTVVLNGVETYAFYALDDTYLTAYTMITGMKKAVGVGVMCDKLIPLSSIAVLSEGTLGGLGSTYGTFFIKILKSRLATPDVTGLRTYLATNNMTAFFPLATPTDEELDTNTTHDLFSLQSYDGQTNVYINSPLNPSLVCEVPKTSVGGYALKAFCDANRPDYEVVVTLDSSSWIGTSAPYTYTITNSNIDGRDVEVNPAVVTTDAEETAINKAMFTRRPVMDSIAHTITLKALGVKPTIAIPVVLSFKGVV